MTAVLTGTVALLAAAAVAAAAVAGPAASTAAALGIADSGVGRDVTSMFADRVPASVGPAAERALYVCIGVALMVAGELVDKSAKRRTVVLKRYCESFMGLIRLYRTICCHSPYHGKLPIRRRLRIDPGSIMGLSKQSGCVPDGRGPSWQTNRHCCLSS